MSHKKIYKASEVVLSEASLSSSLLFKDKIAVDEALKTNVYMVQGAMVAAVWLSITNSKVRQNGLLNRDYLGYFFNFRPFNGFAVKLDAMVG